MLPDSSAENSSWNDWFLGVADVVTTTYYE